MSRPSPRSLDTNYQESPQPSPIPFSPSARPQFPFPHHDASRRVSRRESTSSITSIATSIGSTLDTTAQVEAGLNELSQNSISSLLSPSIVRTGLISQSALPPSAAHRAPTVRDIPPVTLTSVPHVESSAFTSYLSRIGPLFNKYQNAKAAANDTTVTKADQGVSRGDQSPDLSRRVSNYGSPPATPLTPSTPYISRQSGYFPVPSSPERRRKVSGQRLKRDPYAPTPLSTIPAVYFEENFQLENPRTFDVVSERYNVLPPARDESAGANGAAKVTTRKVLHTNAILQEKLSWYMDTVEVHLINSIAVASQSFFAALGSLKDLQSQAEDSIAEIKNLRAALKDLDEGMAVGGLEIVSMRRRRENVRKLGTAVRQVCDVMEDASNCEHLVDSGDLEGANASLVELENLIEGNIIDSGSKKRDYQCIDLRQLKALDGLNDGIAQLRLRIGRGFEARFVEALTTDLRQHVEQVPPRETLQRWANASLRNRGDTNRMKATTPAYLKPNEELKPALLSALAGLGSSGQATRAATAYREAVMREIKSLIRRSLPSSNDDDAESTTSASTRGGRKFSQQEKSAILARNLRALEPEAAEELLVNVYTAVGEALRRLGVQVKVLLDVSMSIEPVKTSGAVQVSVQGPSGQTNLIRDEVAQALNLSSLLGQAVDVVQTQITKVLKVRAEQNARLPLPDFLRYFTLNRLFADECEAVSSKPGESLKDVVNSQVKEFLQFMSEIERQHMVQTLEADRWEAKDFGPQEKAVLDHVLESMTRTPQSWASYRLLWEDAPTTNMTNGDTSVEKNGDNPSEKARPATIDEQNYILVSSSISALHSIEHFTILIAGIPSLTVEAALKMLDFLKVFNSRCCQLILGAGATRSAGLKNITTKHLALASQACSFIIALIPYLREYIRRQAPTAAVAVLPEFDKVKRLFQEHQSSIQEKLVDIMSQRSGAHVNAMKKIQWDDLPDDAGVNAYVEALTKETGTLHRVLSRHVSEMEVRMILMPIFAHYSREWMKAFREVTVHSEKGKANLLRDAEYLASRFARIEDSGDLGVNLVALVNDKKIEFNPSAEPVSSAKDSTTTPVPKLPTRSSTDKVLTNPEKPASARTSTSTPAPELPLRTSNEKSVQNLPQPASTRTSTSTPAPELPLRLSADEPVKVLSQPLPLPPAATETIEAHSGVAATTILSKDIAIEQDADKTMESRVNGGVDDEDREPVVTQPKVAGEAEGGNVGKES